MRVTTLRPIVFLSWRSKGPHAVRNCVDDLLGGLAVVSKGTKTTIYVVENCECLGYTWLWDFLIFIESSYINH